MSIDIEASKIMAQFNKFTDGVRVMMLINRGIGNTNKGSKRWLNKLISTNPEEFQKNLEKLLNLQHYLNDIDNRIYLSLNPRKMDRAIKYLQHKQIDLATEQETLFFYKNINNSFCSALMKPENRDGNLFLIDYDKSDASIGDFLERLTDHSIKNILTYKTPNGWHIICEPFNPAILEGIESCEIKKDALLLLSA